VGEQAVETDRYPHRGEEIHDCGDGQIGRGDQTVPKECRSGDRRGEREQHSAKVGDLLGFAHLCMHRSQSMLL